jgi:hypothetical protein
MEKPLSVSLTGDAVAFVRDHPRTQTRTDRRCACGPTGELSDSAVCRIEQRGFALARHDAIQQESSRRRVAPALALFFVCELAAVRQGQPPLRSCAGIEHDDGRPRPRLPGHVAGAVAGERDNARRQATERRTRSIRSSRRRNARHHSREAHERRAPPPARSFPLAASDPHTTTNTATLTPMRRLRIAASSSSGFANGTPKADADEAIRELHRSGGTRLSRSRTTLCSRASPFRPSLRVTPLLTSKHVLGSTLAVPTYRPPLIARITISPPATVGQLMVPRGNGGSEFNPRMSAVTRVRLVTCLTLER